MAAQKRIAKKTKTVAKKKKAPARRRQRDDHIKFRCVSGRCTAIPKHAHIGEIGEGVTLEATNTDVVIKFTMGSPFRASRISLDAGEETTRQIVNQGTFEYDLSCSECSRRLSGPPSMIVD